jgi:hypothetical protein
MQLPPMLSCGRAAQSGEIRPVSNGVTLLNSLEMNSLEMWFNRISSSKGLATKQLAPTASAVSAWVGTPLRAVTGTPESVAFRFLIAEGVLLLAGATLQFGHYLLEALLVCR